MRSNFASVLGMWLVLAIGVQAATLNVIFTSLDGDYNNTSNWDQGALPGQNSTSSDFDRAIINNGRIATTSSIPPLPVNTGQFFEITVGNGPVAGTLFNIGHALPGLRTMRLGTNGTDAEGDVNQTGGDVSLSDDLLIGQATGIGTPAYRISGGSLEIGDELTVYSSGTFSVNGSGAMVSVLDSMTVQNNATLEFVLGTLGVKPVDVTNSLTINTDSRIVVVGSDYEALDGYFPLITAGGLSVNIDPRNITLTGFGSREPSLVQQSDGLWLRLTAPPAYSASLCSLAPDSAVIADYANTDFSASRGLEPTISAWATTFHEAHVMDTQLSQNVLGGGAASDNLSWQMRVGRGGHLYSLCIPSIGETVPLQWQSTLDVAPWVDEVWQGVAVDTVLNNSSDSKYFIHQAGVYIKDPI